MMKRIFKSITRQVLVLMDIFLIPLTFILGKWLRFSRISLFRYSKYTKKILLNTGVFPIIDHYYEPLFNTTCLRKSLREDRLLPAIDFNTNEQICLVKNFNYQDELLSFPRFRTNNTLEFSYDYGAYPSGDSELLYSMIRYFKPRQIIEIGSGSSTLMAINAIRYNNRDNINYDCKVTCIEPFEQPWLEKTGFDVLRKKVEEIDISFFSSLKENDILFIDSSHIIRPQGDVLYEILEILPHLNPGVLVHFHDICTPKDYFDEWIINFNRFWNEQYILEAFLSYNMTFKIVLASNYLFHNHYELLISKCPILKLDREKNPIREVGSFWIRKIP